MPGKFQSPSEVFLVTAEFDRSMLVSLAYQIMQCLSRLQVLRESTIFLTTVSNKECQSTTDL